MNTDEIKKQVQNAAIIIEQIDEQITNDLVKSKHASKEFKELQRISNALLNTIRSIDTLKYEL